MDEPDLTAPRDHGGNLDAAMQRHGGAAEDWVDLSTGINRVPFPIPPIEHRAWADLPTSSDMFRLREAAARAFSTQSEIVPMAGAQAAIQAYPHLERPKTARVLAPTYNEHTAALRTAGWNVDEVDSTSRLEGAGLAVVVNPNNPDGRRTQPDQLLALAGSVGLLVVDESFADAEPGLSLCPHLIDSDNIVVLRSFGKFYGLAGVRLGFAIADHALARRLAGIAGPWPVSGPAIEIACRALADADWQKETMARLARDAVRLDAIAERAGWRLVGGTPLFRTYDAGGAAAAQERLAARRVWSRIFPYSNDWIRLGLPGEEEEWMRLENALN